MSRADGLARPQVCKHFTGDHRSRGLACIDLDVQDSDLEFAFQQAELDRGGAPVEREGEANHTLATERLCVGAARGARGRKKQLQRLRGGEARRIETY